MQLSSCVTAFYFTRISQKRHCVRIYSEDHFLAGTVLQTEHDCNRTMHVTSKKDEG